MERIDVLIRTLDGAAIPVYATDHSSGVDLCAFVDDPIVLAPMDRALVPTGIFIGIPEGFEAEVRPRSGIAHKHGVTVLNTPGTIDSDYRGEVKVILINLGSEPFTINRGDRIAQMVFKKLARVDFRSVASLTDTCRGQGGFGSTGV
ncbi:MAG: dUTP diphosphatase [Syntrophorhabdaceae bacterium]|nr:dUTP diphosphatase [Syntrophorhabdaceae bacterium]